jgi:hypothetical protein
VLARANDVQRFADGEAWARFAAVAVSSGDCIVIPAGASVAGSLEEFWGGVLRIHRRDTEASYLANPDEFILAIGVPPVTP